MKTTDLIPQRLTNQYLIGPPATSAADLVEWLGAVQSQDYAGAKWALGQRLEEATSSGLDDLYNQGAILRTHILRPTWHFVAPQDLRWLQQATAHRVFALMKYQQRQLELSPNTLDRYMDIIGNALTSGVSLTRQQLFDVFERAGMPATGQRGAYVMMQAELTCLVASGPMQGKQHTYALLDERAPGILAISDEEALSRLAVRYFQSHGPGTVRDLAWWSSLTLAESQQAIELAGGALESTSIDGTTWWSGAILTRVPSTKPPIVRLLPNYDEYFSRDGKTERYDGPPSDRLAALHAAGRFDHHHIVIHGRLRGGWKRKLTARSAQVTLDPFDEISQDERTAIEGQVTAYARFLNLAPDLSWTHPPG